MLTAIPRYGARVLPNTQQIIAEVDGRGQLLEGPQIAEFETAFARRFGARHAIATSRVAGFTPVFADVDPATFTITPESLAS